MSNWILCTLQGSSGASPCLWLAIMCLLAGALSKKFDGLTFRNAFFIWRWNEHSEKMNIDSNPLKNYKSNCRLALTAQTGKDLSVKQSVGDLAWLAPDGNDTEDLKFLCAKGAAMSRKKCCYI